MVQTFVSYQTLRLLVSTGRSGDGAAAREEVAALCRQMSAGHCASPLAFVTVLQLAEEDAETAAGAADGPDGGSGRRQRASLAPLLQRFLHQHPGSVLSWLQPPATTSDRARAVLNQATLSETF